MYTILAYRWHRWRSGDTCQGVRTVPVEGDWRTQSELAVGSRAPERDHIVSGRTESDRVDNAQQRAEHHHAWPVQSVVERPSASRSRLGHHVFGHIARTLGHRLGNNCNINICKIITNYHNNVSYNNIWRAPIIIIRVGIVDIYCYINIDNVCVMTSLYSLFFNYKRFYFSIRSVILHLCTSCR